MSTTLLEVALAVFQKYVITPVLAAILQSGDDGLIRGYPGHAFPEILEVSYIVVLLRVPL